MPRTGRFPPTGPATAALFMVIVAGSTFTVRVHELPVSVFAASAAKVAAGEVWLLPASALVVDRPVDVGLVAFFLLGFTALLTCGTKIFWVAAVMGHLGSTLAVYAIIGAARLADGDVFPGAVGRADFGVSAMQGAWVGAIATSAWVRARADPRGRAVVASGVCVLAGVAWWLHPDPSILTTEHLFAFVIGCGVIAWPRLAASARTTIGVVFPAPRRNVTTTTG